MNRFVRIFLIVVGIFMATAITMYLLARFNSSEGFSLFVSSLITGGIVAGLSIPVLFWLVLKSPSLDSYSGFALEEVELDEDELTDAVSNWVYANNRKRVEGEIRFLEDEDGNVSCRATVRKD